MHAIEQEVLQTLVALDTAVKGIKSAQPKPDLQGIFRRLDELTDRLPPETDPGLMHYLRKKSFEKARLFLAGRESENARGNCGHV